MKLKLLTSICLLTAALGPGLSLAGGGKGTTPSAGRGQGDAMWTLAPGYEVSVSGGKVLGQAYQSPNFRSLLVLLEPGQEGYLLDLTDRSVRSIKVAAIDYTDHGARPQSDAVLTPAGKFSQDKANIAFKAGSLNVQLLPQPPLVGNVTLEQILKRKMDYARSAAAYAPDSIQVARIRNHARPVQVVVFFGTWCGACRKWLPRFLRTIELADNPRITVRYIAVGEGYKEPRAEIDQFNMHLTPSFILMDGKREFGRIKGKPVLSMERDLAELLAGQ